MGERSYGVIPCSSMVISRSLASKIGDRMRNGSLPRFNKPYKFSEKRIQFASLYKIILQGTESTKRCAELSECSALNPASNIPPSSGYVLRNRAAMHICGEMF